MSWRIDPRTGDYVTERGSPVEDKSLAIPAYYRLMTPRTQWLYAPDTQYGSDLALLRKRSTTGQGTRAVLATADRALEPLVTDGRAISARTSVAPDTVPNRNNFALQVKIVDAQGVEQDLGLPPIEG